MKAIWRNFQPFKKVKEWVDPKGGCPREKQGTVMIEGVG